MMTDPIADMLSRIRNAANAQLDRTELPASKLKERLAKILKEEGFISDFQVDWDFPGTMTIFLKYGRDKESAIAGIRRASRPGRRVYVGYTDIPKVLNGLGLSVVSTSKGLMTDETARQQKIGGEILCEVW